MTRLARLFLGVVGGTLTGGALAGALSTPARAAEEATEGPPTGPCDGPGPRNDIAVEPFSFAARAIALQYERYVLPPRFSLVGGLGLRGAALGDYSSTTYDGIVEWRYWFLGRRPFVACGRGAMAGPYVGFHFDTGYTTLRDRIEDRTVGSQITFTEILGVGYRGTLWRFFEITPSVGLAVVTETDPGGHFAAYTRLTLAFGLTAGWMF